MRDLRIAIISWAFTNFEPIGEGVDACEITQALSRYGVSVEVFCQKISIRRRELPENVNIHILSWGGKKYSARFLLETLIHLATIRHKIDLIHQLQYEKTFLPYFGKPYILSGYLPYKKYLTLKKKGIDKALLEERKQNMGRAENNLLDELLNRAQYHFNKHLIPENLLISRSRFIIARHGDFREWLIQRGCDEEKIKVIPVCIDTEKFKPATKTINANRILFVGRLTQFKGVDLLVRVMPDLVREIPSVELWIAGDGPLKNHMVNLMRRFSIHDHVKFLGKIPQTRAHQILSSKHIILPSLLL